jgi:hypothetical protein
MTISRDEFKKTILDLLKTDEAFRAEFYSLFAEAPITKREIESLTREIRTLTETTVKRMDSFEKEMRLSREETNKRMDSFEKSLGLLTERMDSFEKEMRLSREETNKRIDSFEKEMKRLHQDFNVGIGALGARWGFAAEESFREAIRGILGDMNFTVQKWEVYDDEGIVFNEPSVVEADVIIRDNKHILIEIKSSMSRSDVISLVNKAKLYEKLVGVKPFVVIVSPFVEEEAKKRANTEKIQVYTRVREFKLV